MPSAHPSPLFGERGALCSELAREEQHVSAELYLLPLGRGGLVLVNLQRIPYVNFFLFPHDVLKLLPSW